MENIAKKKFAYDHASSYKSRGRLGISNRNVRAQRASENRHQTRMDELSKRRRMPLSPLADENVIDNSNAANLSTSDKQKDNTTQPELSRREKLMKWREERKLKKGSETHQKKSFVVRHVQYDKDANLFASAIKKATKGGPLIKPSQFVTQEEKAVKRVTRASARIAKQASSNPPSEPNRHGAKKAAPKSKAVANGKIKEKVEVKPEKTASTRVTRQSVRANKPSKGKGVEEPSKPNQDSKNEVKTRSQAKESKDLSQSETCPSNPNIEVGENPSNCGKANFPALEAIKNTVSLGRGSTEGVERGQTGLGSNNEASSFAPADFKFRAPSGINTFTYYSKTFKFQPLSPNSAAEFMFPTSASSFFSPKKPAEKKENFFVEDPVVAFNKSITLMENKKEDSANTSTKTEICPVENMEACSGPTFDQTQTDVSHGDNAVCSSSKVNVEAPDQPDREVVGEMVLGMEDGDVAEMQGAGDEQHDAKYFRNLVKKETDRLNEICAKWEKISAEEENLSEEVSGQIRTTIGQAQLLIDQRFRQFSGLIDLSEDKNAEKQATASDLQGFWEMIYFQVEDVNAKFDALEKLKENNWQEEEKKRKKVVRKTKAKKPTAGEETKTNSKVTAARNRIQEMRLAMKAKMAADKEKLKAEKRHQEEEAFVTILTPVKKSKKNHDDFDEIVLTPVRRSVRNTPQKRTALRNTPAIVSTPKIISEDSPGLRLTPDNANIPSDMADIGACVGVEGTREEATRSETSEEDVPQDGMEQNEIKFEQETTVVLKSACKSTLNKSRKTPGRVTFQSPAEIGDQQRTPECKEDAVVTPDNQSIQVDSPALSTPVETEACSRKISASKRFSGRKCRGRVSTPFYQNGTRRRVSKVDEDVNSQSEQSEGQTSSDSDGTDAKSAESCPRSGLRRSTRRTPSKYRDINALQPTEAGERAKTPANVSVKLFHATEESSSQVENMDIPKEDTQQDLFSKYLCPSSSDEDECANKSESSNHMADNVFETDANSADYPSKEVTSTPPEEPETFITNNASKTGRTPIHIVRYLSETDTPTPNSRQITPMPKTTIFVSPNGTSETPAIMDSLGMMSPENVVRRFPAQSEASPVLSLVDVAGKESQTSVTPSSQLTAFHLDSPVNNETRRDSVFFSPLQAAGAVRAQENLMSFSPVVEAD